VVLLSFLSVFAGLVMLVKEKEDHLIGFDMYIVVFFPRYDEIHELRVSNLLEARSLSSSDL
jgi:hypothetical protein